MIQYNVNRDKGNKEAPVTSLLVVYINDKKVNISQPITLPYGIYKVRMEFIGVNYKAPRKVTYHYKLEGFDLEWSEPISEQYVRYNRLEDGKYTFYLKACNEEGICIEKPVEFSIRIKIPFWKAWWFYLIVVAVLTYSVIMIIKYRERKQRKFQEYLQLLLDERTAEVVRQKDELEDKNKQIMDSINYARRIQSCMLPSVKKLKEDFTDSFVFYRPRDVVSGDFFWFNKFKDDRYVLVCADCTGHGVPGSLVSMIGITLIKDIVLHKKVNSPADILVMLQNDFQETLNQNQGEALISNDGMDISVCEINKKTFVTKFSSAMRPVLIKTKKETIHLRGAKMPIGGVQARLNPEGIFENQEVKLNKGDIVYLFSDGYIDQFGGEDDQKYMVGRFKQLIDDMYDKPMSEQHLIVKEEFDKWKGDKKQIDDVLVMGIKI
jgi:serine phosphatase RsbU (regulator of sigma subunit)